MVVWRGVQGGCGVFFQTCNRARSNRLPVVDSPQCWEMVSCSWLSLSDLSTLVLSLEENWILSLSEYFLFATLISFSSVYLACLYKTISPFL